MSLISLSPLTSEQEMPMVQWSSGSVMSSWSHSRMFGVRAFCRLIDQRQVLQTYGFKIAVRLWERISFPLQRTLPDDPYGPVVDRCARIAKLAGTGTVICTFEYRNQLDDPSRLCPDGHLFATWVPQTNRAFQPDRS